MVLQQCTTSNLIPLPDEALGKTLITERDFCCRECRVYSTMSTFLPLPARSNELSFLPWALSQVPGVKMGVAFSEGVRMEFSQPFYVTLGLIFHHN